MLLLQPTYLSKKWLKQPSSNTQSHMNTQYSGLNRVFLNSERQIITNDRYIKKVVLFSNLLIRADIKQIFVWIKLVNVLNVCPIVSSFYSSIIL